MTISRSSKRPMAGLIGLIDHRLPLGVVALDHAGRVRSLNHVAREIVRARDGLTLADDETLVAVAERDAARLRRLIAAVCSPRGSGRLRGGGALGVARRSGLRHYVVLVTAVDLDGGPGVGELGAVVFICDPEQRVASLTTTLRQLYALSDREVDTVRHLLSGASLRDIAAADGIQPSTARTYVKRVLKKIGARDQADLVRRLLSGPLPAP